MTDLRSSQGLAKKTFALILIAILAVSIIYAGIRALENDQNPQPINDTETPVNTDNNQQIECGDGICQQGESCYSCAEDCKCQSQQYCDQEAGCTSPECGNGVCEPYESPQTCCLDCKCTIPAQVCNQTTQACQTFSVNLTDGRAIELATNYYQQRNYTVISGKIMRVAGTVDNRGKLVSLEIKQGWRKRAFVSESGEVKDVPAP